MQNGSRKLCVLFALLAVASSSSASALDWSGVDWDTDGVDDGLEKALANKYFPDLNMHSYTYRDVAYGSRGQFYGTNTGYAQNGLLPFTAHIYWDSLLSPCHIKGRCIEVRYGMAYNWDLGDDIWGDAHPGDTEMVSYLLRTDSAWSVAQNDSSKWYVWKVYRSAHACSDGDSSTFQVVPSAEKLYQPNMWVAEGKNGNYASQSACNNGGVLGADDCGDSRRWFTDADRNYAKSKLRNVYEFGDKNKGPFPGFVPGAQSSGYRGLSGANIIPKPAWSAVVQPSGSYNVWGSVGFGSAGTYCRHLTRFLDWYYHDQYDCDAHPDCP